MSASVAYALIALHGGKLPTRTFLIPPSQLAWELEWLRGPRFPFPRTAHPHVDLEPDTHTAYVFIGDRGFIAHCGPHDQDHDSSRGRDRGVRTHMRFRRRCYVWVD